MSESTGSNVVFLAHRNDAPTDVEETLVCGTCRNKTWKALYDATSQFPRLTCTCCGTRVGYFGWVKDEDAK